MTTTAVAVIEFKFSNRWWDGLWGGSHTAATDPTKRGWRAAPVGKVLVVGRRGVPGCFSVMQLSDGRLDVAVYDEATPESIAAGLRGGVAVDVDGLWTANPTPGWALPFIAEVERGTLLDPF
jgi:hypothetical protein